MPHEQTQSNAYDDALVQIVALFDTSTSSSILVAMRVSNDRIENVLALLNLPQALISKSKSNEHGKIIQTFQSSEYHTSKSVRQIASLRNLLPFDKHKI